MDDFDDRLRTRLERLEMTLPVSQTTSARPTRVPFRLSLGVVSGIAAVALLAGAVAGATVVSESVRGHPGLFAPGGPFQCTRIRQMSPPQAEAVLEDLGYDVTWQVEDRGLGTSEQKPTAPPDGYIIEGVLDGANLLLVVERGEGAEPVPVQSSC